MPRRARSRVIVRAVALAAFACVVRAEDDVGFARLGPFDAATVRVPVPRSDGDARTTPGGVPDVPGEEGEVLCHYPTPRVPGDRADAPRGGGAQSRASSPPPPASLPSPEGSGKKTKLPLALFLHPTHGYSFETWASRNAPLLELLASRGIVTCSPTRVGAPNGEEDEAPIAGGLLPGAQTSRRVVRSRVYPRLKDFALRALTHVLRLSEISGDRDPFVLDGALDPRSVAVMGFSAGGPLALYAAEASQRLWPGAVKAAVAIAPTVGVSEWALDQFEREAPELAIPTLLIAGSDDAMGGLDGLIAFGDKADKAPRVGVVARGATHCHLYIPVGSQCGAVPGADQGGAYALDRHLVTAFLEAYLKGDRDAAKAVWAGAEAINAAGRGRWDVRAKTVPNVEVKVAAEDRSQRGADARSERPSDTSRAVAYRFDPRRQAWTARVPLAAFAETDAVTFKRDVGGFAFERACACPVELRVERVSSAEGREGEDGRDHSYEDDDSYSHSYSSSSRSGSSSASLFAARLDANRLSRGPAQALGASVVAHCAKSNRRGAANVELVLEWAAGSLARLGSDRGDQEATAMGERGPNDDSDSSRGPPIVEVRGYVPWPPERDTDEVMVRAQQQRRRRTDGGHDPDGASVEPEPSPRLVRLSARNLCDGASVAYAVVRVSPPVLRARGEGPFAKVRAQGDEGKTANRTTSQAFLGIDGDDAWAEDLSDREGMKDEVFSLSG